MVRGSIFKMLEKVAAEGSKKNKEALDRLLKECDRVFIVAHNRPDMDAIGSAIGMSLICKKKKKDSYIVLDDDFDNGEEVALPTIGSFRQKVNKARIARNPLNGKEIKTKESRTVTFRPMPSVKTFD